MNLTKNIEDREEDFSALFHSILGRINETRAENDKIIVLDREVHKATLEYAKTYNDVINFKD